MSKEEKKVFVEDLVMLASHYDVQLELYCLACCWFSGLPYSTADNLGRVFCFLLLEPHNKEAGTAIYKLS
jgi:hypothetical protein